MLLIVGMATALILVANAHGQIYDTNFVHLWEATALLAGDRPYRDFFEWGAPLAAYLSAGMQILVGYRLIGEFLLQWLFIVAGLVIAFHLGFRLSRSTVAPLVLLPLVLIVVARAPTYHYSKLFFIPLGIWLAWRYMDRPGVGRGAALAIATAAAFLFRHDYGIYLGWASVLAFVLARILHADARSPKPMAREAAVYLAAIVIVLAPWAAAVLASEGLSGYTSLRTSKYEGSFGAPYRALWEQNPVRELLPPPAPAPQAAIVTFVWQPDVDAVQQQALERQFRLRRLPERDGRGRLQYEVPNVFDANLLPLDSFINDADGFQWEKLQAMQLGLPSRENVGLFLQQVALLVPILLLVGAGIQLWRPHSAVAQAAADPWHAMLAALVLMLVDAAILREAGYVAAVAPVTGALSARFLTGPDWRRPLVAIRRTAAVAVFAATLFAAVVFTRDTASGWRVFTFWPPNVSGAVSAAFVALTASPPAGRSGSALFQYLHDCTAAGDRLLITGSTPFHVSYYAERPVAGGHLYWHSGWGADPDHEAQSLALLQHQSVPIAVSTHDPLMDDFRLYPRIKAYLETQYVEVPGSHGRVLVDRRRQPTGVYEPLGYPCFA